MFVVKEVAGGEGGLAKEETRCPNEVEDATCFHHATTKSSETPSLRHGIGRIFAANLRTAKGSHIAEGLYSSKMRMASRSSKHAYHEDAKRNTYAQVTIHY